MGNKGIKKASVWRDDQDGRLFSSGLAASHANPVATGDEAKAGRGSDQRRQRSECAAFILNCSSSLGYSSF